MPRITSRLDRRSLTAAALVLLTVPALAGCAIGTGAATTTQRASGNGANATAGAIQVRGLTLVEGPDGTRTGTLVMTLVNTGNDADALVGAAVLSPPGSGAATIVGTGAGGGNLALPSRSRKLVGYNSEVHVDVTGLTLSPTQFTEVELSFQRAGRVVVPVMSVLPRGIYEGITPLPVDTT